MSRRKGRPALEYARQTIRLLCSLLNRSQEDVIYFTAVHVGGGPRSPGPLHISGVLSALVVLGYIEETGRGRKNTVGYRATRESLRRLQAELTK